ncbi:MAG: hypothetical protein Q8850_02720, partial [Candidatus Phytoplasma australasiaticum]|nr:hypothetical protein [Candidatus Phytoplasma australasiaticum]
PVEAPEGTEALPNAPETVNTSTSSKSSPLKPAIADPKSIEDLNIKIASMDAKFENLQDLIMSCHFKLEGITETLNKVKDITKETGTDVGKIHHHLVQVIKETIRVALKIQNSTDAMATTLTNQFDNLKTTLINTILTFCALRVDVVG